MGSESNDSVVDVFVREPFDTSGGGGGGPVGGGGGGAVINPPVAGPTGKRAATLTKCKKKKGKARAKCNKKAKALPV